MKDQELDKIVEKWVDDETASAPRLRPTADMYERVASLGRKRFLGALFTRRLVWAAAGTALTVLVLISTLVYSTFLLVPGTQIPHRAAFVPEKGPQRGGPPPKGKGPRGGQAHFRQFAFQIKGVGSSIVRSIDVLALQRSRIVLTAEDSYRLVLEPAADRYVYVYQQSPSGTLQALYPNEAYSPAQNPARAGEMVYLPSEPNGFYLEDQGGAHRLYVVVATGPVSELETLYEQYSRPGIRFGRQKSGARLLEQLDALASGQIEGASGWTFGFEVR